ncbi:MAG: hypothetical protein ACRDRJ_40225 [Streptosporangiaceae bacterium]
MTAPTSRAISLRFWYVLVAIGTVLGGAGGGVMPVRHSLVASWGLGAHLLAAVLAAIGTGLATAIAAALAIMWVQCARADRHEQAEGRR